VSLCFPDFVFDEHSLVEMLCLCGARQRGERETCEERGESVSFYEYNNHRNCNSRALYIRLYCSILMFRKLYKKSVV
jgi:hypothetical protein